MRALLVIAAVLAFAAPAAAATTTATTAKDPNALSRPDRLDRPPVGHRLTGKQAIAIALRVPKIRTERRKHPKGAITPFLKGGTRWQVSLYDTSGRHEVAQVQIDDYSGAVLEAWTGPQVAWTMTRGYAGAFGRKSNALYIWIPLLVLFVVPFVDWRRPFRMRHLDLLVLGSLSISLAFFNHANLGGSVPTFYPPLLYLFARLTWIGLRRERRPPEPLKLLVPATWLAVALVFLTGFRIGLNVTNSNVIDVGYAGAIGADRITHGQALYGDFPKDNPSGDTYGPVNYLAYVPFELVAPWHGRWDDVPAAHIAAVFFDLLCIVGLFLLGRRIRGPTMGIALAYAWVTYPFTLFALESNANDGLVAALLVMVLLAAARPALRGVLAALAGMAKFAPLALAPVLSTHTRPGFWRFWLAFAATAAVALMPVWLQGDVRLFYDRTVGFQASRDAPLSVWGLYDWPHALQVAVQIFAIGFALLVAVLPRRRDVIGLAALMGAILIALQLGATYWFYLYIEWFAPLALVALIARDAEPGRFPVTQPAREAARSSPHALAASSG